MNTTTTMSFPCAFQIYLIPQHILSLIGIICNTLLLIGLIKDPLKCFKNSASYLILNLAFSDILTCVCKIGNIYWNLCVEFDVNVIQIFNVAEYISWLSILFISLDRYLSVVHPMKYNILVTGKKTFVVILLQWVFCIISVVLEIFFIRTGLYYLHAIAFLLVFSSTFFYAKTAYKLKEKSRYLMSREDVSLTAKRSQNVRLLNEKRFLCTIFLTSIITITTLMPIIMYDTVLARTRYGDGSTITSRVHTFLYTLFVINFVVNPLIYCLRLRKYRKTCRLLFCKSCMSA